MCAFFFIFANIKGLPAALQLKTHTNTLPTMMDNFILWFESMELLQQVFWACAIVSSLFFVVQLVLMLIGIDGTDVDADALSFDGDTLDLGGGFSLLTVKNLIHFALGLGWAGVSLWNVIPNRYLLVAVSLVVGVLMVVLFVWLFRNLRKLESNGSYNPTESIGQMADVYLPIPASRAGTGKVQLALRGSVLEFDALTDNGERLATGTKVRVVELLNGHTVVVEKI